jgi:small subunit ribosomal protein S17
MENQTPKLNKEARQGGKFLSGKVVSTKMKDTVVVVVSSYVKHPKYGKYMRYTKRYKAHDKGNVCTEGDLVTIKETKPISKDKHFIVIERNKIAEVVPEIVIDNPELGDSVESESPKLTTES